MRVFIYIVVLLAIVLILSIWVITRRVSKIHKLHVDQLRTLLHELQQVNSVIDSKLLLLEKEKTKAGNKLTELYVKITDMMVRYLR